MIEFTEDQIKEAATTIKIVRLASTPGMDLIAIRLNCEPTHQEIESMRMHARALGYTTANIRPFDAAEMVRRR